MPHTNNYIEGFHNALKTSVTNVHPNIWTLITALKKEEVLSTTIITHFNRGDTITKKKKYRDTDQRIRRLLEQYDPPISPNKLQYLRGIAYSLKQFDFIFKKDIFFSLIFYENICFA